MIRAPNGVEITRITSKAQALSFYTQREIDWTSVCLGKDLIMIELLTNARFWTTPSDSDVQLFMILSNDSIYAIIDSKPVLGFFHGDYFIASDAKVDCRNMIEAFVKFNGYKTQIWFDSETGENDEYLRELKATHLKKK